MKLLGLKRAIRVSLKLTGLKFFFLGKNGAYSGFLRLKRAIWCPQGLTTALTF